MSEFYPRTYAKVYLSFVSKADVTAGVLDRKEIVPKQRGFGTAIFIALRLPRCKEIMHVGQNLSEKN